MNTFPTKQYGPQLKLDNIANAFVIAATVCLLLFATTAAELDSAPGASQVARNHQDGRTSVAATQTSKTRVATGANTSSQRDMLVAVASR